ncbi:MAG: hypothetical protein WC829_09875 [Hyphomicrobium sp.]|jgi:hypothetical protein
MKLPSLHDNWLFLLRKSWAVRWAVVAGLLSGAEVILPLFVDAMPRMYFAALSMAATMGSIWARILVQPKDGL